MNRRGKLKKSVAAVSVLLLLFCCSSGFASEWAADTITGTNMVRQTSPNGTNYLMGKLGIGTNNPTSTLHVIGDMTVTGPVKVPKQGDVSMGSYTNGDSAGGVAGGGFGGGYTQVTLTTNWTRSGTAWTTAPSNSANAVDNDPETHWGDAKIAASGQTVVYWDLGSVITGKIVMVADVYNSGGNNASMGLCYSYDNVTAVSNTAYVGYYISGNNYGLRFVSAATSWAGTSKQPLVIGFQGRYVGAVLMAGSSGNSYFRMHEFQVWKEN
jgi:hypothetical protein